MISRLGDLFRANRILLWVCLITMINQLGFGIVIPVLPLFVQRLGGTEAAVGAAVAAYGLGRLIFDLPTGQLTDRLGRRPVMIIGETITAVGTLLCGLAASNTELLFFRFLAGMGSAAVLVVGQIVVADVSSRGNRGRMMGVYMSFFQLAVGIGPIVGGLISVALGPRAPFVAFAVLAVVAGLICFTKLPETRKVPEPGTAAIKQVVGSRLWWLLLGNLGFVLVGLIGFAATAARTGGIFTVVPATAYKFSGLTASQVGLAITIANLLNFATVPTSGVLADRLGRKATIVPGAALVALSFVLFSFQTTYPIFVLSAIFWGLGSALYNSPAAAYAADMAPPGANGTTMGVYRTLSDLGYVVGPLSIGLLADQISPVFALLVVAASFVVIVAPFMLFAPETRRKVTVVTA